MANHDEKLELQGFNNLTKSLSFNLYDISYAKHPRTRREYIQYIDESYSADRLTSILREVTRIIGATVLNIARQDYHPEGSSVTMLIADGPLAPDQYRLQLTGRRESTVAHLDKSHICVHTYPESHPHNGISTFRADIDVSTCGEISPLRTLDFLLSSFEDDVVTIDYRVRGFTRDKDGGRHYIDHEINSIRDYIAPEILTRYESTDLNIEERNLYHTRLMIRDIDLDEYLFGEGVDGLPEEEHAQVTSQVQREMLEIYLGHRL